MDANTHIKHQKNANMKYILSAVYIKMFKGITQGLSKFFTKQRVIILLIFLILAFVLYNYSDTKRPSRDGYSGVSMAPAMTSDSKTTAQTDFVQNNGVVVPAQNTNMGGYTPKNTGDPSDLLPSSQSGQFSDFNMLNQGNIVMPDLLDAGYLIGLDTIGQSLRNPNYQERSDPIIPKVNVGPWNNSTIEPDLGRIPLEIGCGMR